MRDDKTIKLIHRAIDESPRVQRLEARTEQLDGSMERRDASMERLEATLRRNGILLEACSKKLDHLLELVIATNQKLDALLRWQQTTITDSLRLDDKARRTHATHQHIRALPDPD